MLSLPSCGNAAGFSPLRPPQPSWPLLNSADVPPYKDVASEQDGSHTSKPWSQKNILEHECAAYIELNAKQPNEESGRAALRPSRRPTDRKPHTAILELIRKSFWWAAKIWTLCNFEPQIWLEMITHHVMPKCACFKKAQGRHVMWSFSCLSGQFFFLPKKIASCDGCFLLIRIIVSGGTADLLSNMMQACIGCVSWMYSTGSQGASHSYVCITKQSENSRRLWLFPGSCRGFPRKTPGKSREKCWKNVPESRNATNSRISGTGKGKPAGHLGSMLAGPCPTFHAGCFSEG